MKISIYCPPLLKCTLLSESMLTPANALALAGTMLVPERRTEDGFEFHFCLNYLGHFLLTNLLLDLLKKSGRPGCCSRIVNMSSATHYAGVIQMDDLNRR